ncbi:MAG: DoxX family protein [Bryobacteraceae bacterium]
MGKAPVSSFEPSALSLLRIVAGFMFCQHGLQKLFGMLGGVGGKGGTAEFITLSWVAGFLETFGGLLVLFGLFTRPVAFILSGLMACAYFMQHAPQNFWTIRNGGELAALYCFVFLYLFAAGGGPWSLDRLLRKKT